MVDATTQAALDAQVVNWRVLVYADFDGDVLRGTSGLYDKTISGSGDSELDGTYDSFDHNLIQVSTVKHNETGSDTVSISLGGLIVNLDYVQDRTGSFVFDRDNQLMRVRSSDFLNIIGDKTRWQGRIARLWFYCVDENENQVGSIIPYYTGYMNEVGIGGSADSQTVTLTIENYLVSIAGAQNKTYLIQNLYDSGDLSGEAAISAANGMAAAGSYGYGAGGGGGGEFAGNANFR
ncbi:MAG TPA: hypothetical protein VLA24_11055 [Pseudomonadales bacterium]|nr:hypothetical protein [Pseudomonadales bacterium]